MRCALRAECAGLHACTALSNSLVNCGSGAIAFHCGTNQNGTNNLIANMTQQARGQGTLSACDSGGNPTWPNISHGFDFTQNIVVVPEQGQVGTE